MRAPQASITRPLAEAVGRPHPLALLALGGALALVAANAAFGLSHVATGVKPDGVLARAVDVNVEGSLPTLYGSALLLVSGLLTARVALLPSGSCRAAARHVAYWATLAAGLIYLSVDELTMLHQRLLPALAGDPQLLTGLHGEWVLPAVVLVALAGVTFIPFLRRLPTVTRSLFLLAAAIYLGGAIGGELASGLAYRLDGAGVLSGSAALAEEGMELLGVSLYIHALLAMPLARPATSS